MKRILLLLTLLVSACMYSAYLWQKEVPAIRKATIDHVGENHYRINALDQNKYSFMALDKNGALTPLLEIPQESSSNLYVRWVDEQSFFMLGMFDTVAFATLAEGIVWRLNNEEFSIAAGQPVSLISHIMNLTPQGTALIHGQARINHGEQPSTAEGYIAEIDRQGHIIHWWTSPNIYWSSVRQLKNDGYIIFESYDYTTQTQTGLAGIIHEYNWQHEPTHQLPLQQGKKFQLSVDEEIYTSYRTNDVEMLGIYSWANELKREIPISIRHFNEFGYMRLTGENDLMLYHSGELERRTLQGDLLEYHHFDTPIGTGSFWRLNDDGSVIFSSNTREYSLAGAGLQIKRDANDSILFSGTGMAKESHLIKHHVIQPRLGKERTVTQKGSAANYIIDYCTEWCNPYPEPDIIEPGICNILDTELLEDGSFITLGLYCEQDDAYKLVITRY